MRLTQRQRIQTRLARALDVLAEARRRSAVTADIAGAAECAVADARAKLVALNVRQYGRPTAMLGGNTGSYTRPNPAWIVGSPNGVFRRTRLTLGTLLHEQARREAIRSSARGERNMLVKRWTERIFMPPDPEVRVEIPLLSKATRDSRLPRRLPL